ncbi:S9 family peptidase [Sphingomonas immobilis]|uniref:S9 family peptidase n=1 Tax=Sphingomonas immobilis TaxID=3063997 RepID=A0ABT9A500_9SPHN|nr:S9 family peptidase [Sphingomonas sp. CA1-15]MDO7844502.1 S9 family peptidase [Sphingomonas sp. CA1-15]
MKTSVLALALVMSASALAQTAKPPVAAKKPFQVTSPNGAREDDYYWLRDDTRKNPEMLAYLKAENAYADAVLAPTKPLQDTLFKEIVGRIKQDDSSVPYLKHGYHYYTRFETGADYPIVARRKGTMTAPEEILLDQSKMAAGSGFFSVGDRVVSPDDRLLAYAEDKIGRRQYVLKVKAIAGGAALPDTVPNVEPNIVWADDNKTLFYIEKDPVTLLSKRVKAHVLGAPASADRLVYEEKDDSFYMGLKRTTDDKYVCIEEESTVATEQRCTSAADPGSFQLIAPRERDHLYQADHIDDRWIIRTNRMAPNYKLMVVGDDSVGEGLAAWSDLIATSADVFIEDFKPFDGFIAVAERSGGVKRLRIVPPVGKATYVQSDEPAYAMAIATNEEPGTRWLRYTYDSLTTPQTTYEVNAQTGERRVLKVQPVPGYDAANYVTERVWSTARDGTKVPVSLVYKKGFKRDGKAALLQYAYGSYGNSMDPAFNPVVPSLLDRGMVYAIAHVRGGQEMGRKWYDDGHLLHKKNSFTDFIDVTRDLVAKGYAAKGRVAAQGGSAGGLLVGGVANMAPADYAAIYAQVPFVDVVTTMLDASIPLTTNEYDEWGNPAKKPSYDYMLSYSPYDNVAAKAYPALFVSTGLWDSQVQYYEPTKWVAKLRANATGRKPLVFRVNMEAGHGGKSGRFQRYRDTAEALAFTLTQLGVKP